MLHWRLTYILLHFLVFDVRPSLSLCLHFFMHASLSFCSIVCVALILVRVNIEVVYFCFQAPYQTKLIDFSLLVPEEIEWLNNYHSKCSDILAPYLDESEKAWLKKATQPVCVCWASPLGLNSKQTAGPFFLSSEGHFRHLDLMIVRKLHTPWCCRSSHSSCKWIISFYLFHIQPRPHSVAFRFLSCCY